MAMSLKTQIEEIAKNVNATEWKSLARKLKFSDTEISHLEHDNANSGVQETIYQMLSQWLQKEGQDANVEEVTIALNEIRIHQTCNTVDRLIVNPVDNDLERFSIMLKQRYKKPHLPGFLWLENKSWQMDELFVNPIIKEVDIHGTKTPVDFIDFFFKLDENQTILIEAAPGYGKSTILMKLAFDWANGKEYLCRKYRLVLKLSLSNYNGNIDKLIDSELEIENKSCTPLQALHKIEHKVLLLLDGFDELTTAYQKSLLPLLTKQKYTSMTIVMTSRTQFRNLTAENGCFWFNHRLELEGIHSELRMQFLEKYTRLSKQMISNILATLATKETTDFLQCPLFLMLMAVVIDDKESLDVKTKTDLYKAAFNYIVRENAIRNSLIDRSDKLDLFAESKESWFDTMVSTFHSYMWYDSRNLLQLLLMFGQLVVTKLKNGKVDFSEEEIVNHCKDTEVLSLGFLTRLTERHNRTRGIEILQPLHMSFIDFLAALYLSSIAVNESQYKNFQMEIQSLMDSKYFRERFALIFSFLGGLLQNKGYLLIDALKSVVQYFRSNDLPFMAETMFDMERSEELKKSFVPCLPAYVEFGDNDVRSMYLQYRLEERFVQHLQWNMKYLLKVVGSFVMKTFFVIIDEALNDEVDYILNEINISCNEFICKIVTVSESNWKIFLKLTKVVTCDTFKLISSNSCLLDELHKNMEITPSIDVFIIENWLNMKVEQIVALQEILLHGCVKNSLFLEGVKFDLISDSAIIDFLDIIVIKTTLKKCIIKCCDVVNLCRINLLYNDKFSNLTEDDQRSTAEVLPKLILGSLLSFDFKFSLFCNDFSIQGLYVPSCEFQHQSDNLSLDYSSISELAVTVSFSLDVNLGLTSSFRNLQVLFFNIQCLSAHFISLLENSINTALYWFHLKSIVIYHPSSFGSLPNVILRELPLKLDQNKMSWFSSVFGGGKPKPVLKLINFNTGHLSESFLKTIPAYMLEKKFSQCIIVSIHWMEEKQLRPFFPINKFSIERHSIEPCSAFENFNVYRDYPIDQSLIISCKKL